MKNRMDKLTIGIKEFSFQQWSYLDEDSKIAVDGSYKEDQFNS